MPKSAAARRQPPPDDERRGPLAATAGERRCETCGNALPASARAWRRFCSTRCRVNAWHAANRPPERPEDRWRETPLHWHFDGAVRILVGNGLAAPKVYWRGEGCPPGCYTPLGPGDWSTGIPEGREGMPPERPR